MAKKHKKLNSDNQIAVGVVESVAVDGPDKSIWISNAAYFHAQARGFAPGHEIQDWLDAEEEYIYQNFQ